MRPVFLTWLAAVLCSVRIAIAQEQLSSAQAGELAARFANEDCQRRFDTSPFQASAGTPRLIDGRWHWHAASGIGRGDVVADVSFSPSGEHPSVKVDLMYNRR